ncbi:hypothetical protein TNCV_3840331 [Trichonephila clavipes]|nr:hypothetical protein TNCV_3840331 [Trichonephila clavipes]
MENRHRGRSPLRWRDINILRIKNWKTVAKSRADDILVCSQERNAINTVQFSDKSMVKISPVICYTDGSKIDGRVGFAFVVFRSGVESENFQFRIRDECTVFVAELLCLNFAVKWITEQNSVN